MKLLKIRQAFHIFRYFLMNEAGLIVLHSDWLPFFSNLPNTPQHLMHVEPHLGAFFACENFAQKRSCIEADFDQDKKDGPQSANYWRVDILALFPVFKCMTSSVFVYTV